MKQNELEQEQIATDNKEQVKQLPPWVVSTLKELLEGDIFSALSCYKATVIASAALAQLESPKDAASQEQSPKETASLASIGALQSAPPTRGALMPSAPSRAQQLTLALIHFFDALTFSDTIHDVFMTGDQLMGLLQNDAMLQLLEELALSYGIEELDPELLVSKVRQLVQFSSLAQALHKNPHQDPIQVLQNPWHDQIRALATKQPQLFSAQDHVPLFEIFDFQYQSDEHPLHPKKLPLLNGFSSGWVIFLDLETLEFLEQITQHVEAAAAFWVFDHLNTLCYALAYQPFARMVLGQEGARAHRLLVAGRPMPSLGDKKAIEHIQHWEVLPTWELFSTHTPARELLQDTDFQEAIEALFLEASGAQKRPQDGREKHFEEPWILWGDYYGRSSHYSSLSSRLVKAAQPLIAPLKLRLESTLALAYRFMHDDWYCDRRLPLRSKSLATAPTIEVLKQLAHDLREEEPWIFEQVPQKKNLPRVVHLATHLIDETHSPTKLLRTIFSYGDSAFDSALLTSEVDQLDPTRYPCQKRIATHSLQQGQETLRLLQKKSIAYKVNEGQNSFNEKIFTLLKLLVEKIDPDLIVFHGLDPLHQLLSYLIRDALGHPSRRLLFEHGSFPYGGGFEGVITSVEDTQEIEERTLKRNEMQCHILSFCPESRMQWSRDFPSLEQYGIKPSWRIATTISNHLETRLTPSFCKAVSAILQELPQLCYAPMGALSPPATASADHLEEDANDHALEEEEHGFAQNLTKEQIERFRERFAPEVRERIIPLGAQEAPSNLTRSMDLYLNEFPFGGCIGILDAMASGLPVVTKYEAAGPPQARYGGLFIGRERACASDAAYERLAIALMRDHKLYYEHSQIAYQQYEIRACAQSYVFRLEEIYRSYLLKS